MKFDTVYGPGRVWITVDGNAVQEHNTGQGNKKEGSLMTCTRFIEAQEGKMFRVHYNFPSDTRMAIPTEIQLYIDGHLIDTDVSGCDTVQAKISGSFEGYNQKEDKYTSTYRAFSFAKPNITNDEDDENADEVCSIKVVIGWRYVVGKIKHTDWTQANYGEAFARKVYKDSKTAIMDIHTVPGRLVQTDSTYICSCVTKKVRDMTEYALVFRYRRRRWLVAEKLVESDTESEDEGFEVDEVKTQRSAKEKVACDARRQQHRSSSRSEVTKENDETDPLSDDGASLTSTASETSRYEVDLTLDD